MKNILIIGDSYSTFNGYIPDGYKTYYPALDVESVEDTWWIKFLKETNSNLVHNNSWSGSTICYTGYAGDCSQTSSFICRYRKLKECGFFKENEIDTLFVFGGTNDSWANAPLGNLQFDGWAEKDLFEALPAICYFMWTLKNDLPNAKIVFLINCDIKSEISEGMKTAGRYFNVETIEFQNLDKENGHPTSKGMAQISEQVIEKISLEK